MESSAPTARSLASISEAVGWTDGIVIKPVVSASATDTWSCQGITSADEQRFRDALQHAARGVMVQPFLPEIVRHGEWSLVFLAGQFSHAVVKRPADGDFRVQEEHGGTAQPTVPSAVLVEDAARVLQAAALCAGVGHADILYARIDGVERDGRLLLMECEAIEPTLYLATSPTAAESLADAIEVQQRRR